VLTSERDQTLKEITILQIGDTDNNLPFKDDKSDTKLTSMSFNEYRNEFDSKDPYNEVNVIKDTEGS